MVGQLAAADAAAVTAGGGDNIGSGGGVAKREAPVDHEKKPKTTSSSSSSSSSSSLFSLATSDKTSIGTSEMRRNERQERRERTSKKNQKKEKGNVKVKGKVGFGGLASTALHHFGPRSDFEKDFAQVCLIYLFGWSTYLFPHGVCLFVSYHLRAT